MKTTFSVEKPEKKSKERPEKKSTVSIEKSEKDLERLGVRHRDRPRPGHTRVAGEGGRRASGRLLGREEYVGARGFVLVHLLHGFGVRA